MPTLPSPATPLRRFRRKVFDVRGLSFLRFRSDPNWPLVRFPHQKGIQHKMFENIAEETFILSRDKNRNRITISAVFPCVHYALQYSDFEMMFGFDVRQQAVMGGES